MQKTQLKRLIWIMALGFTLLGLAILSNQYKLKNAQTPTTKEPLIIAQKPVLISLIRLTPTGEAMFAGFGPIHSTIEISEGNELLGTTTSDKKGQWVMLTQKPLMPGQRQFTTLSIAQNKDDEEPLKTAGETLNIFIPNQTNIDPDFLKNTSQKSDVIYKHQGLLIDFIGYDVDKHLTIRGTAQPDEKIKVLLNNHAIEDTTPSKDNKWVATSKIDLDPGTYNISVQQISTESKKMIAETNIVFQVYTDDKDEKQYNFIIVKSGNSLWNIAERSYGLGNDFEKIFDANQENLRSPELIYPGQILYIPKSKKK